MPERQRGKTIWIIGASTGIGAALARVLHKRGVNLILSARSEDKLKSLNDDLGRKHRVLPFDAGDYDAVKLTADTIQKEEVLDSVVMLAALYEPGPIEHIDIEKMRQITNVNLNANFYIVDAVFPIFQAQGGGQIALCGSVAGYRGLPGGQPYSATKAAVMNFAESLRAELNGNGMDIKLISPGFVKTPLTDKNEFDMPFIIEPEEAAEEIANGLLCSKSFDIHFPKKMTYLMKFLRIVPNWLYFKLAKKMVKEG